MLRLKEFGEISLLHFILLMVKVCNEIQQISGVVRTAIQVLLNDVKKL